MVEIQHYAAEHCVKLHDGMFAGYLKNISVHLYKSVQYLQNILAKYFSNESVAGAAKYFPMKPGDSRRRVIYF